MPSWRRLNWEQDDNNSSSTKDSVRVINENQSQFGETLVTNRTPVIELNSSYGTSLLRDIEQTTGSASITTSNGKITISTGTTANSEAHLDSAEVGRYVPGYSAEIGIGVRVPVEPTGNKYAVWGGLGSDELNGFYFGIDSAGLYTARKVGGVELDKVYQSDFNIDPLDGTGPSGYNLDVSNGNIYQIDFTWYGYGQILYGIVGVSPDVDNKTPSGGYRPTQNFIPCRSLEVSGSVSTYSPNFRIHTLVNNGSDTEDLSIDIGGRQYSIVGNYIPKFRYSGDFRGSVNTSTTFTPLISFRRKSDYGDRSVKLEGFDTLVSSEPCIVEIRLNSTLTNASFGTPTNHTATETAVESDTSATAMTGGVVVWQKLVDSGATRNTSSLSVQSVDFDIPNGSAVTLCARTLTGTGTVTSAFRLREEW